MRYIETSFLLSLILEDEFSPLCKIMMGDIKKSNASIAISALTLCEAIGVIERREKRVKRSKVIEKIVEILDGCKCNYLKIDGKDFYDQAFALWNRYKGVDFNDIIHYLTMKEHGILEVYSLDEHFDIFRDIQRVVGEG